MPVLVDVQVKQRRRGGMKIQKQSHTLVPDLKLLGACPLSTWQETHVRGSLPGRCQAELRVETPDSRCGVWVMTVEAAAFFPTG